jgi:hypothetical protein
MKVQRVFFIWDFGGYVSQVLDVLGSSVNFWVGSGILQFIRSRCAIEAFFLIKIIDLSSSLIFGRPFGPHSDKAHMGVFSQLFFFLVIDFRIIFWNPRSRLIAEKGQNHQ